MVGEQAVRVHVNPLHRGRARRPTTRIEDPDLVQELEQARVKYTGETVSRWLPEILSWVLPLLLLVGVWSFFFRRMGGAEGGVMSFARSRAKIYAEDDVKVKFSDVAGVDEAEDELKEIVEFLQHPKKYTNLGGRIPKGVLLVGPPGMVRRCWRKQWRAKSPFQPTVGFVEMFVGVGAARVRDLFAQAGEVTLHRFHRQLDALGECAHLARWEAEEREQTLNQRCEMDGSIPARLSSWPPRPGADPALLRPGRFDRQVLVDKPMGARSDSVIHSRSVRMAPGVDLKVVAARTAVRRCRSGQPGQ